jgi:hypothetical protein
LKGIDQGVSHSEGNLFGCCTALGGRGEIDFDGCLIGAEAIGASFEKSVEIDDGSGSDKTFRLSDVRIGEERSALLP